MTFLPKLMKDEIIIIEARLNNSVKIGYVLLTIIHAVNMFFIGFYIKTSASSTDQQTLFYFLIFRTPIVYICILIGIANMLTYPNFSSIILTNKRIIFHYGCLYTKLVKTLFKRSPSILLSQIKEIKKDPQGLDIIYYSPYSQDNIIQKTMVLSVIEEPDIFINKLNENIESYKSTNETSREDIDYIKRYAHLFGKTKSRNFWIKVSVIILLLWILMTTVIVNFGVVNYRCYDVKFRKTFFNIPGTETYEQPDCVAPYFPIWADYQRLRFTLPSNLQRHSVKRNIS